MNTLALLAQVAAQLANAVTSKPMAQATVTQTVYELPYAKAVETSTERGTLAFEVRLQLDSADVAEYQPLITVGVAHVRVDPVFVFRIVHAFTYGIYSPAKNALTSVKNASFAIVDEDQSVLSRRIAAAFLAPYFRPPVLLTVEDIDREMECHFARRRDRASRASALGRGGPGACR